MRLEVLISQDVGRFDCGVEGLNNWLRRQAKQSVRGRSAVVYLAYLGEDLVGYFSLSNSAVLARDAPPRIRAGQPGLIPLVLLGRFAIDLRFQRQGFALTMLGWAVEICSEIGARSGVVAIRVDASDARAASFWRKAAGFEPSPTKPRAMFLSLKQAGAMLRGEGF